jgi:glycosyltransferase involved in cell wall biosynthesis
LTVGIPTYKRPEKLTRLLNSLEPSVLTGRIRILICDNACSEETRAIAQCFQDKWHLTTYVPVPERGLSAVRNMIIKEFLDLGDDGGAWLAMLDDDLAVEAEWANRMLDTGNATGADAVGAPYASCVASPSLVVAESIFVKRPRRPTGPTGPLGATGNILLSRPLLKRLEPPYFAAAYGLSGGEDYDFFRRVAASGAKFAWCDEAFAEEEVDFDRLTNRAVFSRYFSTGIYMALIDKTYENASSIFVNRTTNFLKSVAIAMLGAISFNRKRALRGFFNMLFNAGGIAGLFGFRINRYR